MLYFYSARTVRGEKIKGSLEAGSQYEALSMLFERGLIVVSLQEKKKSENMRLFPSRRKILSLEDLCLFFTHLSAMISMGGTLSDSLYIMESELPQATLRSILQKIQDELRGGKSFSESLGLSGDWPPGVLAMVSAGEESGELLKMLRYLSSYFMQRRVFRKKLIGALVYPAFVAIVSVVVLNILFFKVFPQIEAVLADLGIALPASTRLFLSFSKFFLTVGIGIICGVLGMLSFTNCFLKKSLWDKIISKNKLWKEVFLSRSFQTLAALLNSGVPLLEAIKLSGSVTGNKKVERSFFTVAENVEKGLSLGESLRFQEDFFSPLIVRILSLSEKSGTLRQTLPLVSDRLKEEAQDRMKRIEVLAEPIMIFSLGGIVLIFVGMLFFPLLNAFQRISLF